MYDHKAKAQQSANHMHYVACHVVQRNNSGISFDTSWNFFPHWLKPWSNEKREETRIHEENTKRPAAENAAYSRLNLLNLTKIWTCTQALAASACRKNIHSNPYTVHLPSDLNDKKRGVFGNHTGRQAGKKNRHQQKLQKRQPLQKDK